MRMLFPLPVLVAGLIFAAADNVKAATTFLPDYQQADIEFQRDELLCEEAVDSYGNRLYHMADGCPVPKKFDEYCAHDDRYISECYCHEPFVYTCTYPYKGDTREVDDEFGYSNCDDLWVACCDTTCPAGSSTTHPGGCPNTYGSNGCGETCYGPYQECCYPESDETGCSCGTTTCGDAAAARVPAVRHVRSRKNQNRSRHRTNPIRRLLTPENRKTTAIPAPALPAQPAKAAQSAKLTLPMPAAQWFVPNVTIPIPAPDKAARPAWPAARKAVLPTVPKQIAALRFAPNATK